LSAAGCDPICLKEPLLGAISSNDLGKVTTILYTGVVPEAVRSEAEACISRLTCTLSCMRGALKRADRQERQAQGAKRKR
jgi:hypothetical protein